jgi:hypothetical protein
VSETPELDQVAGARRALAAHAQLPRYYWVISGIAFVLLVGTPIWLSYLPSGRAHLPWVLVAVGVGSAAYSILRRRRSGVQLARRISSYPTAYRIWIGTGIATIGGAVGVQLLVQNGHRLVALWLLVPFAVGVVIAQVAIRSAMAADIEAGRVRP